MKNLFAAVVMVLFLSFTTNKGQQEKRYKLELTGSQLSHTVRAIRTAQGIANYDETNALLVDIENQLKPQFAAEVKKDSLLKKP